MGEFFRGWRRKIGSIALMLACVCAAAWVRSVGREEGVYFDSKGQTPLMICSRNHFLTIIFARHLTRPVVFGQLTLRWFDGDCSEETNEEYWTLANAGFANVVTKARNFAGIMFGSTFDTSVSNPLKKWFVSFPYWLITIPLTLVSGYLLVSKPHISTLKKLIEPTGKKGA
jgi:hypothetical protein